MTVEVSPSDFHFHFEERKRRLSAVLGEENVQQTREAENRTAANYLMASTVLINDLAILDS